MDDKDVFGRRAISSAKLLCRLGEFLDVFPLGATEDCWQPSCSGVFVTGLETFYPKRFVIFLWGLDARALHFVSNSPLHLGVMLQGLSCFDLVFLALACSHNARNLHVSSSSVADHGFNASQINMIVQTSMTSLFFASEIVYAAPSE